MVSFVCDACQDVLVKRKLDNHGCGASFSCVDCSVSFPGTSYRTHTSCISEAEKYQKSLYKGKKTAPQANGGPAGSKENGKPSVADESSTKEAVASPSEGKKLSKEEKKKLKSEKKSSEKKDEESKMDVDEAAPQKLSKDEKKKLKAAKETAKVEPASTGVRRWSRSGRIMRNPRRN